jgi:hypothetical protein
MWDISFVEMRIFLNKNTHTSPLHILTAEIRYKCIIQQCEVFFDVMLTKA